MQKAASFFAKVYDRTGTTFRRVIDASQFLSVPTITRQVSGLAGEITIQLASPWDDFGFGTTLFDSDLIKVYAVNSDNPTGVIVYQGHVVGIRTSYTASSNSVELRIYPLDGLLSNALAFPADTWAKTYTTSDIDTMIDGIVTDANTVHGGSYFTTSLGNPGLSITYRFYHLSHLDSLKKASSFLNSTWYWRILGNGEVQLNQWNDSTATHVFTLARDVDSLETDRTIADVKNGELFGWGTAPRTYTFYNDATSESAYGKRQFTDTDDEIPLLVYADKKAEGDISKMKDPKVSVSLTVNANYPIETILPGDTCRIQNISNGTSQLIEGIFRILRTEYDGATCKLTLSELVDNFGNEFYKAINQ